MWKHFIICWRIFDKKFSLIFPGFFLSRFPVNTLIHFTDPEVSGYFQQHLYLIVCPELMSIIRFNFLRRHVLRLHFLFSYYCLFLHFCYSLPRMKVFASYFSLFLRQNDQQIYDGSSHPSIP